MMTPDIMIRRRTVGVVDEWGDESRTWAGPEPLPVHDAAPETGEPDEPGREPSTTEWTLYCPPGVQASAEDLVLIDGQPHEVIGASADWGLGVVIKVRQQRG